MIEDKEKPLHNGQKQLITILNATYKQPSMSTNKRKAAKGSNRGRYVLIVVVGGGRTVLAGGLGRPAQDVQVC